MTTLICAELGLETGRLRYACAGHPPPVILPPEGEPAFPWEGRSPPLDIGDGTQEPRPEAELTLAPGSTVLLYTDGLIERRRESLDAGMDRLLAATAAHRDAGLAGLLATLVRELRDPEHVDDVCLLAARFILPG